MRVLWGSVNVLCFLYLHSQDYVQHFLHNNRHFYKILIMVRLGVNLNIQYSVSHKSDILLYLDA